MHVLLIVLMKTIVNVRFKCSAIARIMLNYVNTHSFLACKPACNTGLMRCTGNGSDDSCVAFENGLCIDDLTCTETNFVVNEHNNYTCGKSVSVFL